MTFSYNHSAVSSGEHSRNTKPNMKTYADVYAKKRKAEDEKLAAYHQKRHQLQQVRLSVEDAVRSCADGVASDSDVEEIEFVWKPIEREVEPYPPSKRVERLSKDDFRAECDEDDYLDATYDDPEDHLEEVLEENSEDASEEELEEDSDHEDDD
ncbi:transcription termination factor 4, mitochondrial-like [Papaver somniferum]|uniref:transcription termination factor 4, mitochondrial-like n=1 Tax=Papaver somniferum TaxID=3469 RepID=UPI000E704E72|nr:transcription termination factor 4, mitochondrial-like [Papaver somniferum]